MKNSAQVLYLTLVLTLLIGCGSDEPSGSYVPTGTGVQAWNAEGQIDVGYNKYGSVSVTNGNPTDRSRLSKAATKTEYYYITGKDDNGSAVMKEA